MDRMTERTRPYLATREQFLVQYRGLCVFYAKKLVYRLRHEQEDSPQGFRKYFVQDFEDLIADALLKLVKCPEEHWNHHYYVQRLIINAIIDSSKARRKIEANEYQPPRTKGSPFVAHRREFRSERDQPALGAGNGEADYFDTLPGRDGLAESTQIKYDSSAMIQAIQELTAAERIVLHFYFGLNGLEPIREYKIAAKLGRTQDWVQKRLQSGLSRLRKEFGVTVTA